MHGYQELFGNETEKELLLLRIEWNVCFFALKVLKKIARFPIIKSFVKKETNFEINLTNKTC